MGVPASDAVRSYRYLRLAIVVLVVLLATSVVLEWLATGATCWETSISAYHHTPARPVFTASVVAAGVCMIVLKGVTDTEDVLLNLAGMLACVVAFVPVTEPSVCRPGPLGAGDGPAAVENGVGALLVAGVAGVLIAATTLSTRAHRIGWAASVTVLASLGGWFLLGRSSFLAHAHYVAAVAMFACIVAVVLVNARGMDLTRGRTGPMCGARNRYTAVAVAMVGGGLGVGVPGWLAGWTHTVLWVETLLLASFAVFWLLQTHELWDEGQRPGPAD